MKNRMKNVNKTVSALVRPMHREKIRRKPRGAWLLLLCLLLATAFSQTAWAVESAKITLHFIVPDCTFSAYQVAEISENGTYAITEQYSSLSVDWTSLEEDDWYDLIQTLDTLTVSESLKAAQTAVTDESGDAVFSGLSAGIYLIRSERVEADGCVYEASSMLIEADGTDQVIEITKYTSETLPVTVEVTVRKIWTQDDKSKRPSQITVNLLRDGEVYDSAVLSADNNWSASWSELDAAYSWIVAESQIPDGYTVTYEQEEYFFVIVNTGEEETEAETETGETKSGETKIGETESGETGFVDAETEEKLPANTETETEEATSRLPQTGAYWPPVILLTCAGILCIAIGRIRERHEDKEAE